MASSRARLIVEVETSDSLRSSEAARQWTEYDERYSAWRLAVPKAVRPTAKRLIEQHALVNVRLVTWSLDFAGLPR